VDFAVRSIFPFHSAINKHKTKMKVDRCKILKTIYIAIIRGLVANGKNDRQQPV